VGMVEKGCELTVYLTTRVADCFVGVPVQKNECRGLQQVTGGVMVT
jgi:hypothetical protein